MFSQSVISSDCCRIFGFSLGNILAIKVSLASSYVMLINPGCVSWWLRTQQQCSSHGMNGTSQFEILCRHLAAGAQSPWTTLPAQEFHIRILLVNTELVKNVFLWKYYLTGHSHMAKTEGSFNHHCLFSPVLADQTETWASLCWKDVSYRPDSRERFPLERLEHESCLISLLIIAALVEGITKGDWQSVSWRCNENICWKE